MKRAQMIAIGPDGKRRESFDLKSALAGSTVIGSVEQDLDAQSGIIHEEVGCSKGMPNHVVIVFGCLFFDAVHRSSPRPGLSCAGGAERRPVSGKTAPEATKRAAAG